MNVTKEQFKSFEESRNLCKIDMNNKYALKDLSKLSFKIIDDIKQNYATLCKLYPDARL